jgi:hypothetical protein
MELVSTVVVLHEAQLQQREPWVRRPHRRLEERHRRRQLDLDNRPQARDEAPAGVGLLVLKSLTKISTTISCKSIQTRLTLRRKTDFQTSS